MHFWNFDGKSRLLNINFTGKCIGQVARRPREVGTCVCLLAVWGLRNVDLFNLILSDFERALGPLFAQLGVEFIDIFLSGLFHTRCFACWDPKTYMTTIIDYLLFIRRLGSFFILNLLVHLPIELSNKIFTRRNYALLFLEVNNIHFLFFFLSLINFLLNFPTDFRIEKSCESMLRNLPSDQLLA